MKDSALASAIREDLSAMGFESWTWREQVSATSRARISRFIIRMRVLEHENRQPRTPVRRVAMALRWRRHARDAAVLGFTIPLNTFGQGLAIAHIGTIVVNENARIGRGCRIHPGVTIGTTKHGVPTIGDNVYIGAGAKITGPISVGDNAVIAPNAAVTKDVPANALVGGVPASVIQSDVEYEWRA
ncbi:MAG: transferase hexapeptide repeat containing protein [Frankiales bacterium]|nr:transferase hexapeptide repeat containing protein [Frankiales bacterium]